MSVKLHANLSHLEEEVEESISSDNLMRHVHEISRYVRMSGSEEEAKSLQYVKRILTQYGFKVRTYRFDAYIGEPKSAHLSTLSPELREINGITSALAPSTPSGGIEGEIVYVGKGTETDFAKQDTRGKLVLVKELAEPEIAKRADNHGTIGQIFINDYYAHEGIVSVVWGSPRQETVSLLPKTPCISITEQDGILLEQLLSKGRVTAKLTTESWRGWKKIPILTADLPGKAERSRFALLAGHIDSWHYGAMDNASANAIMLEVAGHIRSQEDVATRNPTRLLVRTFSWKICWVYMVRRQFLA